MDNQQGGTYRYKGEWGVLDQMVVNGGLLQPDARTRTSKEKALYLCVSLFCWKKIMCMEGIRLSAPIKGCGITEDIAIIFRCCWN